MASFFDSWNFKKYIIKPLLRLLGQQVEEKVTEVVQKKVNPSGQE